MAGFGTGPNIVYFHIGKDQPRGPFNFTEPVFGFVKGQLVRPNGLPEAYRIVEVTVSVYGNRTATRVYCEAQPTPEPFEPSSEEPADDPCKHTMQKHTYVFLARLGGWDGEVVIDRSYEAPPPALSAGNIIRNPDTDQGYVVRQISVQMQPAWKKGFVITALVDPA